MISKNPTSKILHNQKELSVQWFESQTMEVLNAV